MKVDLSLQHLNQAENNQIIQNIVYEPIRKDGSKGTTWTAHALQKVYDDVLTVPNGWRGDNPEIETIVIVLTDGKSNDPKKEKVDLKEQKERFSDKNAKIYALGVGGINTREIRMLTDDDPNSIFYLMSYGDIDQFLIVLDNLLKEKGFDANTCLPTDLDEESVKELEQERRNRPEMTTWSPETIKAGGNSNNNNSKNNQNKENSSANKPANSISNISKAIGNTLSSLLGRNDYSNYGYIENPINDVDLSTFGWYQELVK